MCLCQKVRLWRRRWTSLRICISQMGLANILRDLVSSYRQRDTHHYNTNNKMKKEQQRCIHDNTARQVWVNTHQRPAAQARTHIDRYDWQQPYQSRLPANQRNRQQPFARIPSATAACHFDCRAARQSIYFISSTCWLCRFA